MWAHKPHTKRASREFDNNISRSGSNLFILINKAITTAITLSIIMEVITIIIQTLMEVAIRTHDMVLRIAIHHRSSATLTIARLGCIMVVIIIMDAALILKQ